MVKKQMNFLSANPPNAYNFVARLRLNIFSACSAQTCGDCSNPIIRNCRFHCVGWNGKALSGASIASVVANLNSHKIKMTRSYGIMRE